MLVYIIIISCRWTEYSRPIFILHYIWLAWLIKAALPCHGFTSIIIEHLAWLFIHSWLWQMVIMKIISLENHRCILEASIHVQVCRVLSSLTFKTYRTATALDLMTALSRLSNSFANIAPCQQHQSCMLHRLLLQNKMHAYTWPTWRTCICMYDDAWADDCRWFCRHAMAMTSKASAWRMMVQCDWLVSVQWFCLLMHNIYITSGIFSSPVHIYVCIHESISEQVLSIEHH
jgi:hypothetical protein